MIGGFPCPGFSEAGPRLVDDPRNFLYIHFIRALIQTQPEFFVAENVKGMMTLGHGEVLNQIVADFAAAGYTVTPHLVNARDYGVPQSRERVFLIGVHKEKIENKTYTYEEYNTVTKFVMMDNSENEGQEIKTKFYFDGNKLEYIKTIVGNKQELLKVDISDDVDNNLFEIPSEYKEM